MFLCACNLGSVCGLFLSCKFAISFLINFSLNDVLGPCLTFEGLVIIVGSFSSMLAFFNFVKSVFGVCGVSNNRKFKNPLFKHGGEQEKFGC